MKPTALVSIIIPTYNRAHLIGETLNSIISQTYENWECIVVDDGSTDGTNVVMQNYLEKDTRIQYHHRPENHMHGGNGARNYGFEVSKGEYIQWFDSDDLMHPEKLNLKLKNALFYESDIIIDKSTEGFFKNINIEDYKVETFSSSNFYIDFILGKKPVITNDVMIKRKVIRETRFDEHLLKAQEYEFLSRIFQQKLTYCFADIALTFYKPSNDSISRSNYKKQAVNLIYLSKKIKQSHTGNPLIIAKTERQGRKTYKSLILKNNLKIIFQNFSFFKKSYHQNSLNFLFFIFYNIITKKGFDRMKPKKI